MTSIRNKGNLYKKKKTELAEVRTESGIKTRTLEMLKVREKAITEILAIAEEERGIGGYFSMQEQARQSGTTAESGLHHFPLPAFRSQDDSIEQITASIRKLNAEITDKKAQLAPVIKDLRPLRQQCQDLQFDYEQKKANYDTTAAGLESALVKLEQETKRFEQEANRLESSEFRAKCDLEILTAYEAVLAEEMKCFVSTDGEDKSRSMQFSTF